jgi:hypothetical protein
MIDPEKLLELREFVSHQIEWHHKQSFRNQWKVDEVMYDYGATQWTIARDKINELFGKVILKKKK